MADLYLKDPRTGEVVVFDESQAQAAANAGYREIDQATYKKAREYEVSHLRESQAVSPGPLQAPAGYDVGTEFLAHAVSGVTFGLVNLDDSASRAFEMEHPELRIAAEALGALPAVALVASFCWSAARMPARVRRSPPDNRASEFKRGPPRPTREQRGMSGETASNGAARVGIVSVLSIVVARVLARFAFPHANGWQVMVGILVVAALVGLAIGACVLIWRTLRVVFRRIDRALPDRERDRRAEFESIYMKASLDRWVQTGSSGDAELDARFGAMRGAPARSGSRDDPRTLALTAALEKEHPPRGETRP